MSSKLKYLPIAVFLCLPGTFICTYLLSYWWGHVSPYIPSISDTAATSPESCVFGMMLNVTAALLGYIMYVRHKQVIEFFRVKEKQSQQLPKYVKMVNLVATLVGILSCVGLDIVANFQIETLPMVHDTGAIICYWSSSVYIVLQTLLSFWMVPEMNSLVIVTVRGFLGVISAIFIVTNIVTAILANHQLHDALGVAYNRTVLVQWSPDEPGFVLHLASGISQWITVLTIGSFILTYYLDFERVTIYPPELVMHSDPPPRPVQPKSFKNLTVVAF